MNDKERRFEEVIKPEDRLNEELLDDVLGGAICKTGEVIKTTCNTGETSD